METLQGEGPFTVFAPTDEAFAALPEGTVESLLEDPEALKNILLYHVVGAKVLAADAVGLDGQDVEAVFTVASQATDHIRAGGDPVFIEALTYRFEGHYFGEPQVYRTREEVEKERRERDPIVLLQDKLVAAGSDLAELDALNRAALDRVEAAVVFAEASPAPDPDTFADYVYV